jgi:hypothetical protein
MPKIKLSCGVLGATTAELVDSHLILHIWIVNIVFQMGELQLNIFQRLTRRWEAIHPYNAAQVMRIEGRLDANDAANAWAEAMRTLGLGTVHLTKHSYRHEPLNGEFATYPLRVLDPSACIAQFLTAELNRAFDHEDEPPFRPFFIQHETDFEFGVIYQHWIADSVSIQAVLREWFVRLFDPSAGRGKPMRQARSGYWGLFGPRGAWHVDETALAGFRSHMRHRRVRKVMTMGKRDYPSRVRLFRVDDGLINRILSYARRERCKVHDVLLAAICEACDQHLPTQTRSNRPDMSIGSIVDLRPQAGNELNNTFGMFLGFSKVMCRPQDLRDWPRLLRTVASQNQVHKRNGIAQASMVWMGAAQLLDSVVPNENLYRFYRKEIPTSGGLSNVNMNVGWAGKYAPQPLKEYWRISPTGPLAPLVFSTTTLGSSMFIALTCRDALLPSPLAENLAQTFLSRLRHVAG